MEDVKASLERWAEAAQAADLPEDERYALTQLTRLAPEQDQHVERLNQLGGAIETEAGEALPEFDTTAELAQAPTATEEFMFESQTAATPVGESEFEWNEISQTIDGLMTA